MKTLLIESSVISSADKIKLTAPAISVSPTNSNTIETAGEGSVSNKQTKKQYVKSLSLMWIYQIKSLTSRGYYFV